MKTNTFEPMLAMIGLGGWEIVLIFVALLVFVAMIGGVIALVVWLTRRSENRNAPPPVAPTKRTCPQCGKEMSADSTQGLCPSCLMKVGLGTETANAGEPKREPAAALAPAEIAKNFPQLEILELLGQGGMGLVYKARQPQLDRFVALKILSPHLSRDPAFAERFNREAKALARLNHPNIVGIYDFGVAGAPVSQPSTLNAQPLYYFLMEFVDGLNLSQMEQVKKRLAPEEALAIVPKICDALQYAHDEGVVHRDIKPGNILVDKKGRVKIADFGLAKLAGKEREDFSITQSRMTLGTPQYMAPEQFEDPQKVDHRADIYSLGVVFYEMLTGELPLGRFAAPSKKVQVDVRLDEIVLRSLERDVELRYQHVSEVKSDVETITKSGRADASGSLGIAVPPTSTEREAILKRVRNPAIGLFITGILSWVIVPFTFVILWRLIKNAAPMQAANMFLSIGVLPMIVGTLMILAGQKMKRLEAHGLAVVACVLPMAVLLFKMMGMLLTGSISINPADLVGAPMGLWALVVLSGSEVKAAFARATLSAFTSVPADSSRKLQAHLAWALPAAALILALGILGGQLIHKAKTRKPPALEMPSAAFGPVIERTIPDPVAELPCVLDLETGKLLTPPVEVIDALADDLLNPSPAVVRWMRDSGADVALAPDGSLRLIEGVVLSPTLSGHAITWDDLTASVIVAVCEGLSEKEREAAKWQPTFHLANLRQPAATCFVTRERSCGVVQILGPSDHPRGVKIRYKLVQKSTDSSAPTAAATTPQTGELEFRLVAAEGDTTTPADELADPNDRTGQTKLRVLKEVLLDSSAVAIARINHENGNEVSVALTPSAARKFADITAANIGRRLAIVWRGRILSAPVIRTQISSPLVVTGNMSEAELQVLLDLLNYKPSPASEPR